MLFSVQCGVRQKGGCAAPAWVNRRNRLRIISSAHSKLMYGDGKLVGLGWERLVIPNWRWFRVVHK
jgi:hypothetical protein